MKDDILFDQKITEALNSLAGSVVPADDDFNKIFSRTNTDTVSVKTNLKRRRTVKAAAAIAVCVLAGGTSVYAGNALTSKYKSSVSGYDYTSYTDMDAAEKKAGYDISAPDSLSYGFEFDGITLTTDSEEYGDGKRSEKSRGINVTYKNDSGNELTLSTESSGDDLPVNYQQKKETAYGTLYYSKIEQYFVPADYEPTADEIEKDEEDPFYEISYGADTAETDYISHVEFVKNGIGYDLYAFNTDLSSDQMFELAEEISSSVN